jgi:hypothetical protein
MEQVVAHVRPRAGPRGQACHRKGTPQVMQTRASLTGLPAKTETARKRHESAGRRVVVERRAPLRNEEVIAESVVAETSPACGIGAERRRRGRVKRGGFEAV